MLRPLLAALAVVFLMGQQGGCATTETTRAERCQGYKTALLAAETISDDAERLKRIRVYRKLITVWCLPA